MAGEGFVFCRQCLPRRRLSWRPDSLMLENVT